MISFTTPESLNNFIKGYRVERDDDEVFCEPTTFELAQGIIRFINRHEQKHRDLQELLAEKGRLEEQHRSLMQRIDQQIEQVKCQLK